MVNIFFSYADADQATVAPIARCLELEGWTVSASAETPPGAARGAREIGRAVCVVVAWSSRAAADTWVRVAARHGHARHRLVVIRLDTTALPNAIDNVKSIDFSAWSGGTDQAPWLALKAAVEGITPAPSLIPWRHSEPGNAVETDYDFGAVYHKLLRKGPGVKQLELISDEVTALLSELPKDKPLRRIRRQIDIAWDIVTSGSRNDSPDGSEHHTAESEKLARYWEALLQAPDKHMLRRLAGEIRGLLNADPRNPELNKLKDHIKLIWRLLGKPTTEASAKAASAGAHQSPVKNTAAPELVEPVDNASTPVLRDTVEPPTTGQEPAHSAHDAAGEPEQTGQTPPPASDPPTAAVTPAEPGPAVPADAGQTSSSAARQTDTDAAIETAVDSAAAPVAPAATLPEISANERQDEDASPAARIAAESDLEAPIPITGEPDDAVQSTSTNEARHPASAAAPSAPPVGTSADDTGRAHDQSPPGVATDSPDTSKADTKTDDVRVISMGPAERVELHDSSATLEEIEREVIEESKKRSATLLELRSDADSEDMEQSELLQAYAEPEHAAAPGSSHAEEQSVAGADRPTGDSAASSRPATSPPIREVNRSDNAKRRQNLEQLEKLYELEALNEPGGLEELDESEALSSLWELESGESPDSAEDPDAAPSVDQDSLADVALADLVGQPAAEATAPQGTPYHPAKRRVSDIYPTTFDQPTPEPEKTTLVRRWLTIGTFVSLILVAIPILLVAYTKYFPSSPVVSLPREDPGAVVGPPSAARPGDVPSESSEDETESLKSTVPLPDLVNVPGGCAMLGSHFLNEGPPREVCMSSFKMSREEITFVLYNAFADLGVRRLPDDQGWGRGNRPVINVSWFDAKAYADFVAAQTGQDCRLPSEAEWEYAARALTTTPRFWGKEPSDACEFANTADLTAGRKHTDWLIHECNDGYPNTAPVASYRPNAFGLYDMLGNVSEWTEDCSHGSFEGAPNDGRPWMGENGGDCSKRVTRGGSWRNPPFRVRSSSRGMLDVESRSDAVGFRLVCHDKS